jgi:hypothetical protein
MIKIKTIDKNYESIGNLNIILHIAKVERFPCKVEVVSKKDKTFIEEAISLSNNQQTESYCWLGSIVIKEKEHKFQDYVTFVEILKNNNKILYIL